MRKSLRPSAVVLALVGFLLFGARDAAAAPELARLASTDRVVVSGPRGYEEIARELAELAADALAHIESNLPGLPKAPQIQVRLVRDASQLPDVAPAGHGAPSWAAGVAYLGHDIVGVAVRNRDGGLAQVKNTFVHELAHIALHHAIGDGAPRWLHEGFAYVSAPEVSLDRLYTLFGGVLGRKLKSIRDLESSFPARHDLVSLAYVQSYDFTAFLARRGRWPDAYDDGDPGPFRQFLKNISQGESTESAAVAAFGRPMHELESEWRASLDDRFLWIPGALGLSFLWVLAGMLLVWGALRKKRLMAQALAIMGAKEAALDAALHAAEAEAERLDAERAATLALPPTAPDRRFLN